MTSAKNTRWDKGAFPRRTHISDQDKQAMADYLRAGLNMGKPRDELLEELGEKYHRSTRQIQRYIAEVESCVPAGAVPSSQPTEGDRNLVLADPVASKLYQEHQNGMIHLVERLKAELEPHLSEFRLRNLGGPSTHSSSVQDLSIRSKFSLSWQVEDGGSVSLHYGLELAEDTETKIMRGYLEQHLNSSSYLWLMEDKEKGINIWKQIGGEELKGRARLLRRIDREVKKLTGKPLSDLNRMNNTGPSTWFSDSIWGAVLDGLYRTLDYKVESIDSDLFKVQYGATFIGLTATKEEGEQYVEWHKRLMARSAKSRTVTAVNHLRTRRELATKAIREALTKFVVDQHIPGKCDYEFCR